MACGGGAFGRWFGPEGGALVNGTSALVKETPCPVCHLWLQVKDTLYEPDSESSLDTKSAGTLELGLSSLQTCGK